VGRAQGPEVTDRGLLIAGRFASRRFADPSGPILSDAPATVGQEVATPMTVAPVAYRGRRHVPELPGGVLRDDCRSPSLENHGTSSRPIATTSEPAATARPVLERVREAIAARHYSRRTERA
jgi:hypothetical protein